MTKADPDSEAAPRRSTRVRTKRAADSDADESEAKPPAKTAKKAPAKDQQVTANDKKMLGQRGKPKPAKATKNDSAGDDSSFKAASKAPKQAKVTKGSHCWS